MVLITIVTGAYKPTYNWGASHCSKDNYPFPKGLVKYFNLAGHHYFMWDFSRIFLLKGLNRFQWIMILVGIQ
jgi:hypothetical protein